jgi:hypothetical protein
VANCCLGVVWVNNLLAIKRPCLCESIGRPVAHLCSDAREASSIWATRAARASKPIRSALSVAPAATHAPPTAPKVTYHDEKARAGQWKRLMPECNYLAPYLAMYIARGIFQFSRLSWHLWTGLYAAGNPALAPQKEANLVLIRQDTLSLLYIWIHVCGGVCFASACCVL